MTSSNATLTFMPEDEDEKSEKLKSAEEHLTTAKVEREAYNDKKEKKAKPIGKICLRITMVKLPTATYSMFPCSIASITHSLCIFHPILFSQVRHISGRHVNARYLAYAVKGVVSR